MCEEQQKIADADTLQEDCFENSTLRTAKIRICIFCNKSEKRVGLKRQYPIICTNLEYAEKLKTMATTLDDTGLLTQLNLDFDISYHRICKLNFEKKYDSLVHDNDKRDSSWSQLRSIHKEAFEAFALFLQDEIIGKENVYYLHDLHSYYKMILDETAAESHVENDFENYRAQHLQEKILAKFGDAIIIETIEKYSIKNIVYKAGLELSKLLLEKVVRENSVIEITKCSI